MSIIGLKSLRKRGRALAAACRYALIALFVLTPAMGRELSDAEKVALKTGAYPEFAQISLPEGTTEILEK
jgi:hypothetical protein